MFVDVCGYVWMCVDMCGHFRSAKQHAHAFSCMFLHYLYHVCPCSFACSFFLMMTPSTSANHVLLTQVRQATMALRDLQEVDAAQLRQSAISVLVCGVGFEEVGLHHEGAVEEGLDDEDSDLVPAYRADEATITGAHCGVIKCLC